jgi:1-phosphofructokinase family hexose kinase
MILTVTINPLLERRISFKNITPGTENRNGFEELKVGGKGINVSRQLNNLGLDNLAYTILGGENGKIIKDLLFKENIKHTSVRTKTETRNNFIVLEESTGTLTTYFGTNKTIEESEVNEFKQKLEKIIQNCEIVVFSGSSPCIAADSIFPYGIDLANKYDKISLLDTYGSHLSACIDAGPTIVHNNISEVEKSLNKNLSSQDAIVEHLKFLYSKGVKQSYLTNGAGTTYAANFDFIHSVSFQQVEKVCDPTGSGDAFTAGIVYGLDNDLTFEQTLTLASKLGAANAKSFEVCNVKKEELENLAYKIEINSIGKKMKILDVTPT